MAGWGWPILIVLFFISLELDPVATRHVLQLQCKGNFTDLDKYRCQQIFDYSDPLKISVPHDLYIQINSTAQKVRIVSHNNVNGSKVEDNIYNCDVINGDNWECEFKLNEKIASRYFMRDGYFHGMSGSFDDFVNYSGLTGIPYWLHRWRILDLKTALEWQ